MGQSGHNTHMGRHRLGCRMPFEHSDVGDGYASPGPVTVYKLSPEEIRHKYGAPAGKREFEKQRMTKGYLAERLQTLTVGQLAERHHIPQDIIFKLCDKFELDLDEKNRLKGDDDMGMLDKAKELLPKEKLGKLLAEGRTQQSIADEYALNQGAISMLKKQYWGNNFTPEEYRVIEKITPDKLKMANNEPDNFETYPVVQQESIQESILTEKTGTIEVCQVQQENITTEPHDTGIIVESDLPTCEPTIPDPSKITWATPMHGAANASRIIQIKKGSVVLNAVAIKDIKSEYIKVGVDGDKLYLVPTVKHNLTYKISSNGNKRKNSTAKFGGGALIKFLVQNGFDVGTNYKLEQLNNGWFVATRKVANGL